MSDNTTIRRSKVYTGFASVAVLALVTGCAAEEPTEEPPADQEVQQSTPAEETPQDQATEDQTAPEDTPTEDDTADSPTSSGDDPVYGVIEAVEAEYADGFIVNVDLDDNSDYDVDVVVDSQLYELNVTEDGSISVDEQETDDENVARADQATVTVTEALDQAFEQHADATFDQIELDDDDGSLHWDIDLDGSDNSEIELEVAATS
ncbi:MAG TPA: hypothetical protein VIG67_02455 [Yaniella sp.]